MFILLLRTILVYICVILAIRIMGKRQLGELQPNEFVVAIIISNIATLSLQDNGIPLLGTMLPIFTLVACEVMVSYWALKSVTVRRLVSGNPIIVIRDGSVDQREMKLMRWTIDDLMEQLRINGIFDINEVAFAIVETSGVLSVCPKAAYRPLTQQQLGLESDKDDTDAPPVLIISDGKLSDDALRYCGVNNAWLEAVLKKEKLRVNEIFIMTCDRSLKYHIIERERELK